MANKYDIEMFKERANSYSFDTAGRSSIARSASPRLVAKHRPLKTERSLKS